MTPLAQWGETKTEAKEEEAQYTVLTNDLYVFYFFSCFLGHKIINH